MQHLASILIPLTLKIENKLISNDLLRYAVFLLFIYVVTVSLIHLLDITGDK